MNKKDVPNCLTIMRFFIAVAILVLMVFPYEACGYVPALIGNAGFDWVDLVSCILFVIGSVSDALDGNIARKYHLVSDFGKFMDPLADKALVNVALIVLAIDKFKYLPSGLSFFPAAILAMFILRDLAVDGVKMMASSKGKVIAASYWGKAKTVAQMIAIPFVFLNGFPLNYVSGDYGYVFPLVLILIALTLSWISGIKYLIDGKEYFSSREAVIKDRKEDK